MERRTFYGPDIDVTALGRAMVDHYTREGYQTQIMPSGRNGVAVQARKGGAWQKSFGMSKALTAVLNMENEYVAAEVGGAEWADKGVAAGIGAIIFFPALITAGVGAFQQSQLQTQTWQFIEQYIRTNSAFGGSAYSAGGMGLPPFPNPVNVGGLRPAPVNPNPAPAGQVCGQCRQPLTPGSKFCAACGAAAAKTCLNCGQTLQANAKFCSNCGSGSGIA